MRVLTIFGTRPEAIKVAPVIRELASTPGIVSKICVTAQHREMLDQVLNTFQLEPDYDLDLMRPGQTLLQSASRILSALEPVLTQECPDCVLVQGDTTTAAVASLAAHYMRFRIGHIEAGLRTFDKWRPHPEEANRKLVSCVADWHFAPTPRAKANLLREGIPASQIFVTGNTGIDSLRYIVPKRDRTRAKTITVTAHRRENFGRPLERICESVRQLALQHPAVQIVFPMHPNPQVSSTVSQCLAGISNVSLCEPLGYVDLLRLLSRSHLVLTDSGGIQEEAPSFGVPVLVLRDITERPEGIESGNARLVGTDTTAIVSAVSELLSNRHEYGRMAHAANPYGDGKAANRIVRLLTGETVPDFQPEMARLAA